MFDDVVQILKSSLQLGTRAEMFRPETPLLGSIPEMDSMAVVTIITAIEENYGIIVDDDEISADTFETIGSLVKFVEDRVGE